MSSYKKIIVAVDINAEYECVINKALEIATSPDDIHLVYITLSSYYIQPYLYGMNDINIDYQGMINSAKEQLSGIAQKFGIAQANIHVEGGQAAEEIKSLANEQQADLIIIGTHGRSGIKLLLGSTATAVLHGVQQDVLAVRMYE